MSTGFWFTMYVISSFASTGYEFLKSGSKDQDTHDPIYRFVLAFITGVLLTALLVLQYFAGVFNYITGFAGSEGSMAVYAIVMVASTAYLCVSKGWAGLVLAAWSFWLLHAMGGLTQFWNLFS
jgi:energy-converting hydrogenase Eha subunit B